VRIAASKSIRENAALMRWTETWCDHWINKFSMIYNLPYDFELKLCGRMYRCAGYYDCDTNILALSTKLILENANRECMRNEIIPHEIAHYVDYMLNGSEGFSNGETAHGENWCNIMRSVGVKARRYHTMEYAK
jgi:hypothetical protein